MADSKSKTWNDVGWGWRRRADKVCGGHSLLPLLTWCRSRGWIVSIANWHMVAIGWKATVTPVCNIAECPSFVDTDDDPARALAGAIFKAVEATAPS